MRTCRNISKRGGRHTGPQADTELQAQKHPTAGKLQLEGLSRTDCLRLCKRGNGRDSALPREPR
eukprot:2709184-Pyramimonas_sp.AAC.1